MIAVTASEYALVSAIKRNGKESYQPKREGCAGTSKKLWDRQGQGKKTGTLGSDRTRKKTRASRRLGCQGNAEGTAHCWCQDL